MTPEQFKKIQKQLELVQEDQTPYAVISEDEVSVVGDATLTQNTKKDYKVSFIYPAEYRDIIGEENIKSEKNNLLFVEVEYKDVFIAPREALKVTGCVAHLLPFFKKLFPDGRVGELDEDEAYAMVKSLEPEIVDAMYRLVGVVLKMDESMWADMYFESVFNLIVSFINDFPWAFNAGDGFFE